MKKESNWQCSECGEVTTRLAVHHVVPVEGSKDPEEMERRCFCLPPYEEATQLQVLCYDCHKKKHPTRHVSHDERVKKYIEMIKNNAENINIGEGFDF